MRSDASAATSRELAGELAGTVAVLRIAARARRQLLHAARDFLQRAACSWVRCVSCALPSTITPEPEATASGARAHLLHDLGERVL
jgi:hypothetical protein